MWDLAQPRSRIETIFEIMAVDRVPRYRGLTCNRDQLASYDRVVVRAGRWRSALRAVGYRRLRVIVDGF